MLRVLDMVDVNRRDAVFGASLEVLTVCPVTQGLLEAECDALHNDLR